jgi:hypothetical protein
MQIIVAEISIQSRSAEEGRIVIVSLKYLYKCRTSLPGDRRLSAKCKTQQSDTVKHGKLKLKCRVQAHKRTARKKLEDRGPVHHLSTANEEELQGAEENFCEHGKRRGITTGVRRKGVCGMARR